MKQVDYDYSLLDIEESAYDWSENKFKQYNNTQTIDSPSETLNTENDDNVDSENWYGNIDKNNTEDIKKRADIFRSF